MENLEEERINLVQSSQSQAIVCRKRTFSESFILGTGNVTSFGGGLQSTGVKLETIVDNCQKQSQNNQDILDYKQDGQLNPSQIQETCKDMSNDSDLEEEQSEGNLDNKNSNEDFSSKKKKVTQAQMLGKTAGRWTKEEHKKFVQAIRLYGKDWRKVEDFVKTRSGAQIRSHAQKYFIRIQKKLKSGEALAYLNQTEDQCNTTRGLELFRQAISLYEDGSQKDQNEDDDDFTSASTIVKRQKLSNAADLVVDSKRGTLNIIGERSMDINFTQSESPNERQSLLFQRNDPLGINPNFQTNPLTQGLGVGSNYFFLNNEKKLLQGQFYEVVKRKEALMSEIYYNDKVDLFSDGRKYLGVISDLLNDIQKLSQKLTIINQISSMIDLNLSQAAGTGNSILERMLILINEIMNLQKILTELVANNELFNKPLVKSPPQSTAMIQSATSGNVLLNSQLTANPPANLGAQTSTTNQGMSNNQLINLFSQVSPPHSQMMQPPQCSQPQLTNLANQTQLSQLTNLLTGIVAQANGGNIFSQTMPTSANNSATSQVIQQQQPQPQSQATNTSNIPSASQLLRPMAQSQQTIKSSGSGSLLSGLSGLVQSNNGNSNSINFINSTNNSANKNNSGSSTNLNQADLLQKLKQIQMISNSLQQQQQSQQSQQL
eukprot:403358096